ncbi:MAG: hypothetical protein B7Y02_08995, partial [Rhodobacterales bacterium 17-64-5]
VRLPATALGPNGTLLVLGPEDRLEEQAVTVLRQEGDDVILAVGALAGREVVTERSAVLGAGIRIRPIRPDAAEASADFPAEDAVALTPERRAALLAMIDANPSMTAAEKADLVQALQADSVATGVIDRLERPLDG